MAAPLPWLDQKALPPPDDPRVVGRTRHLLIDIIVMAICGVIGNCDDWPDIALFAQQRQAWFQRFLRCPTASPRTTPSNASSPP